MVAAPKPNAALPPVALPATLAPQLATLAKDVPSAGEWSYEIKFDGYRILARVDGDRVQLFTRNGHDWTAKMASVAAAVVELGLTSAWLDCEAVVKGPDGLPSFNALQNAFDRRGSESIELYVFDMPFAAGRDLRALPLRDRRAALEAAFDGRDWPRVHLSGLCDADGASVLASACAMGLEGVMATRLDSPYVGRRTETWLKLKCQQRQEFVIGGFTGRFGSNTEVGSLLLGFYDDDGKLRCAGSVGTGWDSKTGITVMTRLKKLEADVSPFDAAHAPTKAAGASARPPASAGSSRCSSPRSASRNGRRTGACGTLRSRGFGRTRRRGRCGGRCRRL